MTVTVALTGNMGSGKSLVSKIFKTLDIPVFMADEVARKQYADPEVMKQIMQITGPSVLDDHGKPDRSKLAAVLFSNPDLLQRVQEVIHPLVQDQFHSWKKEVGSKPYVIEEAAIIMEQGLTAQFDHVIHVSCPEELAITRIMKRDGLSREEILKRMQFQWSDEKKSQLADSTIINDGQSLVIPQVLEIHQKLIPET